MKADIKRRWVEALRSGEYEQGTGALRQLDEDGKVVGYCCLGVLCDVVKDDLGIDWQPNGAFDGQVGLPPTRVVDYAGLDDESPEYIVSFAHTSEAYTTDHKPIAPLDERGYSVTLHLPSLNDGVEIGAPLTFSQIADIIEWAEPVDSESDS